MDSLIGKTIDNYRILEVIGRGGMGVVFKALDTNLEKIVALKMIDPFLARDENFVRRFKTEAKALAKLENANIVGVYALRETESGFFMVMEYVESKPVSQALQEEGPFNLKDTVAIAKQLLNAIGHAHKVGVIHRDIKPSNILLCYDGKIKVTDFGLAKVVQQKGPASTVTQARAGTLYYMSPEQIKGLKNVDTRSDLYSLGMSVYEMIAGRVPFDKTDSDFTIQKKIVDGEIPPPVKFNPAIPKKLTKIISKSIDKDPGKRYQSAGEMLADIESFEESLAEPKTLVLGKTVKSKVRVKERLGAGINFKKPALMISVISFLAVVIALYIVLTLTGTGSDKISLTMNTEPAGAEIFLNNERIGTSPVNDYQLEAGGSIDLRIRKDEYKILDTVLNLDPGSRGDLVFTLIPIPKKKINLATIPSGAKLMINNRQVGKSDLTNYTIAQGTHQLRIEKPGYLVLDTILKVTEASQGNLSYALLKDPDFKGFGTVKINSRPSGAEIFLNGEVAGNTPYENREVPVGEYQLRIRKEGYTDHEETLNITKNRTKNITRTLSIIVNQFGRFTVTSRPAEASVYLDGEFLGSTPYENDKIPVGSHRLVIKKTGYSDYNQSVRIEVDKLASITADLTEAARLRISTDPSGAEVLLNNKSVGTTPYNSDIALGDYTITVTKPGYKPYSENVKINDNRKTFTINQKLVEVMGPIEVLVRPYGSIYIDGVLKAEDITARYKDQIPGGKHTLKITHPTLGSTTKEIMISSETVQKFNFDFTKELKLNVVSNPANCEIFIDGKSTGIYTPAQIRLKPGTFKLLVKKEGYAPAKEQNYNVPSNIFEASNDPEDRIEFSLSRI